VRESSKTSEEAARLYADGKPQPECSLERYQFHKLAGHLTSPLRMVGLRLGDPQQPWKSEPGILFSTGQMLVQNLGAAMKNMH